MTRHISAVCALVVGLASLSISNLQAQGIAESANGTSSIVLKTGGLASINFAEKSIKAGFTRVVSDQRWRLGVEYKAIGSNGILSIFDEHFVPPEGEGSVFAGIVDDSVGQRLTAHWLTAELTYNRAKLSLASTSTANPVQRGDSVFRGARVTGYYNALLDVKGNALFGLSLGYGRRNNYDDLAKVRVCQLVATDLVASPPRVIEKCSDARMGPYETGNSLSGAIDFLSAIPKLGNRVSLDIFARMDDGSATRPIDPGLGVFLHEPGDFFVILGGATLQWEGGKFPKAGLQAGISF